MGRYYLPAANDYARIGELDFSLLFPFSLLILIFLWASYGPEDHDSQSKRQWYPVYIARLTRWNRKRGLPFIHSGWNLFFRIMFFFLSTEAPRARRNDRLTPFVFSRGSFRIDCFLLAIGFMDGWQSSTWGM